MLDLLTCMVDIGRKYPTVDGKCIKTLVPTRNTIKHDVDELAKQMRIEITEDLRKSIDLYNGFATTVDFWTDGYKKYDYLCVTAHYNILQNNSIVSKRNVIAMASVEAHKKDKTFCLEEIEKIFFKFNVSSYELKRYATFISDRGPNLYAALKDFNRLNCYAHLINNLVNSICEVDEAKKIISKASKLVRYFKSSSLNSKLSKTLKSYSETRFNTVFYTLQSVYEMYCEIVSLLGEKEKLDPQTQLLQKITCLPKSKLKEICDFLEPFMKLSLEIEGEKYHTLFRVVFAYNSIEKLVLYKFNDSSLISAMKTAGRKYFEKNYVHFDPQIEHKVSLFLHPMAKQLNKFSDDERLRIFDYVKTLIECGPVENIVPESNLNVSNGSIDILSINEFIDIDRQIAFSEIDDYTQIQVQKCTSFKDFDLKDWWIQHSNRFPKLFKLFMKISSIPATSTPSERAFSTAGFIINDTRNKLSPETVQNIFLVRNKYVNNCI